MYNFNNKSDDQLDALADAVRHEQKLRAVRKYKDGKFPVCVCNKDKGLAQNVIDYRMICKLAGVYISLSEAHSIVMYIMGDFDA